jgi:capsular polysaccharide biosynthesis protein
LTENESWSFRELLIIVLRKWRLVLAATIILALVFGGLKLVSGLAGLNNAAAISARKAAYELSLKNYQQEKERLNLTLKEYENKLTQLPAELDDQDSQIKLSENYMKNSLLMNLDPADVCISSMDIIIDTDYQIMPGMVYQDPDPINDLLAAYQLASQNEQVYEAIRDRLGLKTETNYLSELITIEPAGYSILRVTCRSSSFDATEQVVSAIVGSLKQKTAEFSQMIAPHRLYTFDMTNTAIVDENLKARQSAEWGKINTLRDLRDRTVKEMTDTQKLYKDIETQLQSLVEPAEALPDRAGVLVESIKYLLLGALAGLIIMITVILLGSFYAMTIKNPGDLPRRFSLRILGILSVKNRKHQTRLDRWADRIEKPEFTSGSEEENYRIIRARLLSGLDLQKPVKALCIGLCDFEPLKKAVLKLNDTFATAANPAAPGATDGQEPSQILFIPAASILSSADTIEKIAGCDLAIVFVCLGKTTLSELDESLKAIQAAGKPIAGAVIF